MTNRQSLLTLAVIGAVANAALFLVQGSAIASSVAGSLNRPARPCIDHGKVMETLDRKKPLTSSASQDVMPCDAGNVVFLGQQTYYSDETSESPQREDVFLWTSPRAKPNDPSQLVFLAWEKLDVGQAALALSKSAKQNKLQWFERLQDALTVEDAEKKKAKTDSQRPKHHYHHSVQKTLGHDQTVRVDMLNVNATYAIARVPSLKGLLDLSERLPKDTRMARLVPLPESAPEARKEDSGDHDKPYNDTLPLPVPRFIPPLHALLFSDTLDVSRLRIDARTLTGEDTFRQTIPSDKMDDALISSPTVHWHSRHSATSEARLAAAWIRARMEEDLAPLNANCGEWPYDISYSPNIVCTIPAAKTPSSDSPGIVVISAHYDSRGSFGSTTAPGGDDDGSGTTMLLALARHLGAHRIRFDREVRLVAFSGEEQGLVGSQHYAAHLRNTSTPVRFQLQTDMIGYRKPGEPLQVAFPDRLATANATAYVMAIAKLYLPSIHTGYTPACCSDHQSFWEQGYTSTWIFERRGPIADPCYHDSCDKVDRKGYDFEQIREATRLVLATLLDVAGGVDWPW